MSKMMHFFVIFCKNTHSLTWLTNIRLEHIPPHIKPFTSLTERACEASSIVASNASVGKLPMPPTCKAFSRCESVVAKYLFIVNYSQIATYSLSGTILTHVTPGPGG